MDSPKKLEYLLDSKAAYFLPVVLGQSAWYQHVPFAFWLLEKIKPKSYLEMGVHNGISYFAVCEAIKQQGLNTTCTAVDHWIGDSQAGNFDESVFKNFVMNNEQYSGYSTYKKNNFENAMAEIEDDAIELIHIDGFHSYAAVKNDFSLAHKKINKTTGIILMHDINEYQVTFGVNKFWTELESIYKTFRFNHGHGLGVVLIGSNLDSSLLEIFESKDLEFSNIMRVHFEMLGQRVYLYAENERLNSITNQTNDQIVKLNQMLQAKDRIIEGLKSQFEIDLLRITSSLSWKITGPFRRIFQRTRQKKF
jgi:hypothetical protein